MRNVLVTGATGFIGEYVINELLRQGYPVIASSASPEKAMQRDWYSSVRYIPFDLKETDPSQNYYRFFGEPDLLIHLAWEGLPNYKSDFHINENLPRHYSFLKNMVTHGLKDMAITGTCFEYGMQEGCLSEDMPSLPGNAYAIAKNNLRLQLEELAGHFPFILKWIRLFYMYGKGQSPNSLLSQLQSAIDRGDTSFNMSPGDQLRDYLPVETVAGNIVRVAMQHQQTGIINCCSGVPVQVKALAEAYIKEKRSGIALNLGFYPYSDIEPRNFWGDTTKLKNSLVHD